MPSQPRFALLKADLNGGGGLEKACLQLIPALNKAGFLPTLLTQCPPRSTKWEEAGAEVVILGPKTPFRTLNILLFDRLCNQWLRNHQVSNSLGFDRTTCHTFYRAGNGLHSAFLSYRKRFSSWSKRLSFKISPFHQFLLYQEKKIFASPQVRKIIVNSAMVQSELIGNYDIPPEKINLLYNGVEWHHYAKPFSLWQQQKNRLCHNRCLNPTVHQFLFIGHGYQRKGLVFLLHGLAQLPTRHWELSVVGKDRQLPLFRRLCQQLGIEKQVFFFGAQRDTTPFYQLADTLVVPSIYDPCANVTLEALAMGLYVVSSSYNGGHELLSPHSGAIIAQLDQPAQVARALVQALAHAKTAQNSLERRTSVAHLDYQHHFSQLLELLLPSTT